MTDPIDGTATQRSSDGSPQVWASLRAVGKVILPGTLLASIFYYFGLRYTDYQYRQYGIDDASLDFSSVDYINRSLNVAQAPVRALAIAVLAAVGFHIALHICLHRATRRTPDLLAPITRGVGIAIATAGVAITVSCWSVDRSDATVARSAGWLAGIGLITYGGWLIWIRARSTDWLSNAVREAVDERERRVVAAVVVVAIGLAMGYGMFEVARTYALDLGYRQARYVERHPAEYQQVRLFSRGDLAIDDRLGIIETRLNATGESDYQYRYEGLRMFLHDNDRLVLWPIDQSPRAGMFVLSVGDGVRVEYVSD